MATHRVLVCDDEPHILESISYVVASLGMEPIVAEDGEAAVMLARHLLPDLIVLDVRMPKLSGNQVCAQLKTDDATRHIPIIILTAYGQPSDEAKSRAAGADDFLTKPFSPRELGARIRARLLAGDASSTS